MGYKEFLYILKDDMVLNEVSKRILSGVYK